MATLGTDTPRRFEVNEDPLFNDLPIIAADIIYRGAAVGDNASGYARPLVAGDPFWGFAEEKCDNALGAAGDKRVRLRQQGSVELAVTGATGVGDVGSAVYASDDATFTLTATSNTLIGIVRRWVSSTTCIVRFDALSVG